MRTMLWLLLPAGLMALAVTLFVKLVFVHESVRRRMFPILRPLYTLTNPYNVRAVERGQSRWAVLHHVGRRSGKQYVTPVDAQDTPNGGFIICLVYGPGVDWCRNILAAGVCTLTRNRQELTLDSPEVITIERAAPLLSPERARFWRSIGIEHCLALKAAAMVVPTEPASA
jgi:deazaflavin-dependent oxidoreductase (nitroreductase family)